MQSVSGEEAREIVRSSNAYSYNKETNKCNFCGSRHFYQPQKKNIVCMTCHPPERMKYLGVFRV